MICNFKRNCNCDGSSSSSSVNPSAGVSVAERGKGGSGPAGARRGRRDGAGGGGSQSKKLGLQQRRTRSLPATSVHPSIHPSFHPSVLPYVHPPLVDDVATCTDVYYHNLASSFIITKAILIIIPITKGGQHNITQLRHGMLWAMAKYMLSCTMYMRGLLPTIHTMHTRSTLVNPSHQISHNPLNLRIVAIDFPPL